jgi:hypothetical protein
VLRSRDREAWPWWLSVHNRDNPNPPSLASSRSGCFVSSRTPELWHALLASITSHTIVTGHVEKSE